MPVESLTQSLCDLALRFGEGDEEESMVNRHTLAMLVLCKAPLLNFFIWFPLSFPPSFRAGPLELLCSLQEMVTWGHACKKNWIFVCPLKHFLKDLIDSACIILHQVSH
jgi:hypothetical protein